MPRPGPLAVLRGLRVDPPTAADATLGAIATIGIALLHSTTAGVGMAIVYFVYQQLEYNVLSVVIMSKAIHINQLLAMVSILVGAELFRGGRGCSACRRPASSR